MLEALMCFIVFAIIGTRADISQETIYIAAAILFAGDN